MKLSQANTIHSNSTDLLFVSTYTYQTLKGTLVLNVGQVMSLCVRSALFTNTLKQSILNEPRELQTLGCRR
jgi:hypothetical protein